MNKKVIFIGLGVAALAAGAYFLFLKPKGSASGFDKSADDASNASTAPQIPSGGSPSEYGGYDTGALFGSSPSLGIGLDKSRKEIRRDCRQEARAKCGRGLGKGKPKCRKEYRRACKAAGGYDDGMADFAFNGFDGAFEMI